MKYNELPPKEKIHELLEYKDGDLWWRQKGFGRIITKPAGGNHSCGYKQIMICGRAYLSHRVIYAMFFDFDKDLEIDHINGIKNDNRIENLRAVNRNGNTQNLRKAMSTNKTGLLGVAYHKLTGRYQAHLRIKGKHTYLGLFDTPEEAHETYLQAKRKHHEGCTI